MANALCDGDCEELASMNDNALQSVTADLTPIKPTDSFTVGNDYHVPSDFIIDVGKVEHQLQHIKLNKASGPDGIPNFLLRDAATSLAPVICSIWNASIRDGYIPKIWCSANIALLGKVARPRRVEKDI
jgi:hypothetical protein